MANVHQLLSRIPDDLPFEQLISKAGDLFLQYPPTELISDSAAATAAAVRDATQAYVGFSCPVCPATSSTYPFSLISPPYRHFIQSERLYSCIVCLSSRALKFAAEKKAREALVIRRQNRKLALKVTVVALSAILAGYLYSTLDVSASWEAWFHSWAMSYRTHNGKPDKDILCEQVCLCAFIICACVPVCVSVSLLLRGHLKDITVFLISLFFFSVSSSQHQTFLRMANLTPWLATMSSTDQRFCLCDTLNTNNPPTIQKKKNAQPLSSKFATHWVIFV